MRTLNCRRRAGMSLIEVLMVIVIICVVLSLLLPAILSARQSALRVQCTNNLKQIALALHNYEVQMGVLPPGVVNPTGPVSNEPDDLHVGWLLQLLPFMEQSAVAMASDARVSVYDPLNATAYGTRLNTLSCPADLAPGRAINASSYAGCHHDVESPIDADNFGTFFLNSALTHADIEDGSSHTIFVGEKRSGPDDLGWMSGTRASLRNTGWPIQAGPLNNSSPPDPAPESKRVVGGFGSGHDGGAHFAFGDGSVRFLSVKISPKVLRLLGNRNDGEPISGDAY